MPTYHDGQIIHLPKGWTIECDASTRENGECQGFVFSPKKQGKVRESASLNFAMDCGTTSNGTEMEIPREVMDAIEDYAEDLS